MNDSNSWMEMQQQFQRFWQSLLTQNDLGGVAGGDSVSNFWRQFGATQNMTGSSAFSQWLNNNLQELLRGSTAGSFLNIGGMQDVFRALLPGWPFAADDSVNPFSNATWSPMAPSEFAGLKDLPPLGINREWELRLREVREAYAEQATATSTLGRQLGTVLMTAMQRFQQTINRDNDDDGEITTLRELYDLWVTIAEKAYAEKVMTAEYARAFGNCINTSARARKAMQELTNEALQSMNLPNRREIDSIIERQHSLQAELRSLRAGLGADRDLESLNARVETLTQQLAGLSLGALDKAAPTDRKTPESTPAAARSSIKTTNVKRQRLAPKRPGKRTKPASLAVNEFDIGGIASTSDRSKK